MKLLDSKNKKIVFGSVALRLILGPGIFVSVWGVSIITFLTDLVDGEIFKRAGWTYTKYSICDKILDYYWYIFILAYVFLNNVPAREVFLILFLFRSLGQVLFLLTKKHLFLFLFPNIFEILFFFFLFTSIFPSLNPFMQFPKIIYLLLLITPLVLIREYILHIKRSNLSGFFTGKTTYWVDEKR